MAFKMILASIDGLSADVAKEYVKGDDNQYHLQIEGGEDTAALKRAKDHEKNLRVAAETRTSEVEKERDKAITERDKAKEDLKTAKDSKSDDVKALEASWSEKYNAEVDAHKKTQGAIENILVNSKAAAIAVQISTVPELLEDRIKARLRAEKGADGEYFTRVLDENGAPSAKSVDELQQEFVDNKKYATIIISGKGSGGGAGDAGSGGGADEKKTWQDYSDAELSALRTSNPELYKKLLAA